MCKNLMLLISLVALLGLASSALASNFTIPWPATYTCTGYEEYDEVSIEGYLIIESGCTFTCNGESSLDGNGDDGEGGDGATIIINSGSFICNNRFNIGQHHDGFVYINDGGSFVQQCGGGDCEDGIKFPDNEGGEHRIFVLDGLLSAARIEQKHDRDAIFYIGCNGLMHVERTDEGDTDPQDWLDNGDLLCHPNCCGLIGIFDLGGNVKEILCFPRPCPIMIPPDGATGIAAVTCDLILSWLGWAARWSYCIGQKGTYFIYFGDCDCVTNTPSPPAPGYNDPACYKGYNLAGNATYNVGMLPLWTKYCWRIDLGCEDGTIRRGEIWTFTTGCELIAGDLNLDCMVNFLDYAAVASTWMDEQFFPEGCTP